MAAFWTARVSEGTAISVPESRVENAWKALLVQELELTWRYSIGNAYQEFSFPESVDVAEVMTELGFPQVAASILRTSLTRSDAGYPDWKAGERLLAAAEYVRLSGDARFLEQETPALRRYVASFARQLAGARAGLLPRERYSSDIPLSVHDLHGQATAWAALRAMAGVWAAAGDTSLAATCRRLAGTLERGLRRAVARSQRRLPDGSLFLPARLDGGEQPYASLTEQHLGSYWNLVTPYALASGLFPPGGPQARGALRYLLLHGSRLLGLVRAGGYAIYGPQHDASVGATDEVYGTNVARFLADNHQADLLTLSLYGALAAAMTPNTFVSGEAATVTPFAGTAFRAMYLPPNSASNAAFLEMLRLTLVHETPRGLELAPSTPRRWLQPGQTVAVDGLPTSFGALSYRISAEPGRVLATVQVPNGRQPRKLSLTLRLPAGEHLVAVSLDGGPFRSHGREGDSIDLSGRAGTVTVVARYAR
jgi:hypothetical protein